MTRSSDRRGSLLPLLFVFLKAIFAAVLAQLGCAALLTYACPDADFTLFALLCPVVGALVLGFGLAKRFLEERYFAAALGGLLLALLALGLRMGQPLTAWSVAKSALLFASCLMGAMFVRRRRRRHAR